MTKNLVAFMLTLTLMITISVAEAKTISEIKGNIESLQIKTIEKFSDVKSDSWFLRNVSLLTELGIINGYEDATFKPSEKVTKAQFIKMVVVSLGYADLSPTGDYWARAYISKAQEIGILDSYVGITKENYDVPIPRSDMSIVLVRAIQNEGFAQKLTVYAKLLKDYDSISNIHRDYVLNAYAKGVLTGYEDGEFKPNNGLTRAEAATVIIRMLDKDERAFVNTLQDEEAITRLRAYPKRGDGAYASLPDAGVASDFEVFATVESALTERTYNLIKEFLEQHKDEYGIKDTEYYTNKRLAYNTKKGLVRMRGIIDGVDQEVELGWLKDGTYTILNIIELK